MLKISGYLSHKKRGAAKKHSKPLYHQAIIKKTRGRARGSVFNSWVRHPAWQLNSEKIA